MNLRFVQVTREKYIAVIELREEILMAQAVSAKERLLQAPLVAMAAAAVAADRTKFLRERWHDMNWDLLSDLRRPWPGGDW